MISAREERGNAYSIKNMQRIFLKQKKNVSICSELDFFSQRRYDGILEYTYFMNDIYIIFIIS